MPKFFSSYVPGNRQVDPRLFWEYDHTTLDYQKQKRLVATRVISFGGLEDWYAAFDIYGGIEAFRQIARDQVVGLDGKNFNFMCVALDLDKAETQCYKSRQLRQQRLSS